MHGSCKSVSGGECYVIIVLVVSLVLRGEAVAHVRILYVVATTTYTDLNSSSNTYAWDVQIQFCFNCTHMRHPNLHAVYRPQCNFVVSIIKRLLALELFLRAPIR